MTGNLLAIDDNWREHTGGAKPMSDSVYKVIELIGTSENSWEEAARNAIATASKTLKELRVAEVVSLDMQLDDGKVVRYRAKIKVSFKYLEKE